MILLENGFEGYIRTCTPLTISYKQKKVKDNRKYAYIYTKKGRVLATVDTKTFEAYKVEGYLTKTWKPIKHFVFDKWATLLNW